MSIMSENANAFFIFGVPLAAADCGDTYEILPGNEEEEEEDNISEMSIFDAQQGSKGLLSIGDANAPSLAYGICIKVVDLHENPHHLELPDISARREKLEKQFDTLLKKDNKTMQAFVRKNKKGKPRLFCVLAVHN